MRAREEVKKMKKVQNTSRTRWLSFQAAVLLMDDDIREELHEEMAPCSEQEFFDAYCARHLAKYDQVFGPDEEPPTW